MSSKSNPSSGKDVPDYQDSATSSPGKGDVSALFQKMGSKLGWFEYKDLDSALNSLSNSAKKKSSKSRRKKDSSGIDDSISLKTEGISSKRSKRRENSKIDSKLSLISTTKTPLKENTENGTNIVEQSDSMEDFKIPVRRTPASTDLTKRTHKKVESTKKKKGKENVQEDQETEDVCDSKVNKNLIEKIQSVRGRKNAFRLLSEIEETVNTKKVESKSNSSNCEDLSPKNGFQQYRNQRSSSNSPDSDQFDFGIPIQESTRIYSRASIDTILDIPNISDESENLSPFVEEIQDISYKQLNIKKGGKKRVSIGNFQKIEYKQFDEKDKRLCSVLQNLDLTETNDLYKTAVCESKSNENQESQDKSNSQYSKRSRKSDTFYFDAKTGNSSSSSTDSESPENKFSKLKNSFLKPKLPNKNSSSDSFDANSDDSFYEVRDTSAQTQETDINIQEINIEDCEHVKKDCSSSEINIEDFEHVKIDSSNTESCSTQSSYIEVEDVSLQTCPFEDMDGEEEKESSSKGDNSCNSIQSSHVNIQDTSSEDKMNDSVCSENKKSFDDVNSSKKEEKRSDNGNKTVFFDAESDSEIKKDDSIQISFENDIQNGEPSQTNTDAESFKTKETSLRYVSFSSDEEECADVKKGGTHTPATNFDSSSDDENIFAFKTPKGVLGKIQSENSNKNSSIFSSDEDDCFLKNKIGSRVTKGDNQIQRKQEVKGDNQQKSSVIENLISSDDDSFKDATDNSSSWRNQKKYDSDSSDEDNLEAFFQKMKTKPVSTEEEKEEDDNIDDFIVEDDEVISIGDSSSDDEAFYITTTNVLDSKEKRHDFPVDFSDSETESSENDEVIELVIQKPKPKPKESPKKKNVPVNMDPKKSTSDIYKTPGKLKNDASSLKSKVEYSFLKSLSKDLAPHLCHQEAVRYVKNFTKTKEDLTMRLFQMYNESVFEHKLPDDLPIIWNKRLLKTAGYCVYKRETKAGIVKMTVRIELSTKVCDSAERTRDTLIHELCHAAVWLINGTNGGHGPFWKYWARKANMAHPELPVVKRCHSYSIETKYIYECSKCKYRIGRHSKSLDTKKKVCGHCRGEFILLNRSGKPLQSATSASECETPRTPNRFAMFVKENYKEVKGRDKSMKHGEVMNILSKEFAKQKLS